MSDPVSERMAAAMAAHLAKLARFERVVLAVSGGADSAALMHIAAAWRKSRRVTTEIAVATVDHGLRPSSADEAKTVARAAASFGFPHAVLRPSKPLPSRGVEAAARAARYALLTGHAHAIGAGAIVTAHTRDDQAETVLMRLARGSGVDGLSAMAAETDLHGIALLRPLLGVAKEDLVMLLQEAGADWTLDETNADPAFERARLRIARGAMEALGLTDAALARTATRMARARAALDAATQAFLTAHASIGASGYATLSATSLADAPDEIALRTLQRLTAMIGGKPTQPSMVGLERLMETMRAGESAATLAGCRIVRRNDDWEVTRELRRNDIGPLSLLPGQLTLWDGRFRVALAAHAEAPIEVRALGHGSPALTEAATPLRGVRRRAAQASPAFWREGELLSAPFAFWSAKAPLPVSAAFVHGRPATILAERQLASR